MKLGEKIRRLRLMKGLTQKEFGLKIGFSAATADSRIRKYESCQMAPKEDMRKKIAAVLDVDMSALTDIDIETNEDIMHVLFLLEEKFGMKLERTSDRTSLVFGNNTESDSLLNSYLYIWNSQKQKCDHAEEEVKQEAVAQYERWKARFPKDITGYWSEQENRLNDYYRSYTKEAESNCELSTVSDFVVKLREMSECGITIEAGTRPCGVDNGSLILTFLLSELLSPKNPTIPINFGEYLYQISLMESYGMRIDTNLFTTERGTQISYVLCLPSLMSLKSTVNDIQRFEKQPDNNDWDKEMFENDYENTLCLYDINFKDEIRRHL